MTHETPAVVTAGRSAARILALALIAAAVASCRSAPPAASFPPDYPAYIGLEPGATAYILVDARLARPILDRLDLMGMGSGDRQVARVLDGTDSAAIAIYGGEAGGGGSLRLIAEGNFPSARARLAMRLDRGWRGMRSPETGGRFWHSGDGGISVAVAGREARVATSSDGTPADPFRSGGGTRVPEGFGAFGSGAAVSLWLEEAGERLNRMLSGMGLPLFIPAEQLFASLRHAPVPVGWDGAPLFAMSISIQVASPLLANNLAIALSIARGLLAVSDGGGANPMAALLANPPSADGRYLVLSGAPMTADEIALLLGQFLP